MAFLVSFSGVPGAWRASIAALAGAVALSVGVVSLPAPAVAASLPAEAAAEPAAVDPALVPRTAPDSGSAMVNARLAGAPVEDLSQRTESGSVWALPNGQWTAQQGSGPVWVQTGGDGTAEEDWAQVDLTLEAGEDGVVRPVAAVSGLEISGAVEVADDASVELASVTDAETGVVSAMHWTGALPEPVLEGRRATYEGVSEGLDLVVEATNSGFEQFFVAHDAEAARAAIENPLVVTAEGGTVAATADGGFEVSAPSGEVVGVGATPLAWDAQVEEHCPDSLLGPAVSIDPEAPRLAPLPELDARYGKEAEGAGQCQFSSNHEAHGAVPGRLCAVLQQARTARWAKWETGLVRRNPYSNRQEGQVSQAEGLVANAVVGSDKRDRRTRGAFRPISPRGF